MEVKKENGPKRMTGEFPVVFINSKWEHDGVKFFSDQPAE